MSDIQTARYYGETTEWWEHAEIYRVEVTTDHHGRITVERFGVPEKLVYSTKQEFDHEWREEEPPHRRRMREDRQEP